MNVDVIWIFLWSLIFVAILALVFRHRVWLRMVCVLASLVGVLLASLGVMVAPRMAINRLEREGKIYREVTFADGCRYTVEAAQSALPLFFTSAAVLAALAVFPPKPRSSLVCLPARIAA